MRRMSELTALAALGVVVAVAAVGCAAPASEPEPPAADAAAEKAPVDPTAIRPFEIAVPDEVLEDLRVRLAQTRLPDQLEGADWNYGTELNYLTEFITYWRDEFDWREQERRLNEFDHYKTVIDGLDIHFIHQRSPEPDAVPIIITHGWPGSIAEFIKVIGPLTDPVAHGGQAEDAFHVVAASMPGYGFSDKPRAPGFGIEQIAEVNAALMARLGYERYGIQGGDWGSIVSQRHAFNHPDHAIGLHINMVTAGAAVRCRRPDGRGATRGAGAVAGPADVLQHGRGRLFADSGHQAADARLCTERLACGTGGLDRREVSRLVRLRRRPGNDLHQGRAAYQHHHLLGDPDSHLVGASLLRERSRTHLRAHGGVSRCRPVWPSSPYELFIAPRKWAEAQYNITHWTEMPRGGHFAAMEQPELLVEDLREFFRPLR